MYCNNSWRIFHSFNGNFLCTLFPWFCNLSGFDEIRLHSSSHLNINSQFSSSTKSLYNINLINNKNIINNQNGRVLFPPFPSIHELLSRFVPILCTLQSVRSVSFLYIVFSLFLFFALVAVIPPNLCQSLDLYSSWVNWCKFESLLWKFVLEITYVWLSKFNGHVIFHYSWVGQIKIKIHPHEREMGIWVHV